VDRGIYGVDKGVYGVYRVVCIYIGVYMNIGVT
jgi:hypothetical protein